MRRANKRQSRFFQDRGFHRELDARVSARTADLTAAVARLRAELRQRKRTEQSLRESESRFRCIVETSPDAIAVLDLDGRILMANRQAVALAGFGSAEELHSALATGYDFLVPEERQRAMDNTRKLIQNGVIRDIEYTGVYPDGSRFPFELSASMEHDCGGRPMAMILVLKDITTRREAEEQLRRSEALYRSLVDNLLAGVTLIDRNHTILTTNPAQVKTVGKTSAECIGKKCYRVFEKRDAVCPHCPGVRAMVTGAVCEVEVEGKKDDDTPVPARVRAVPWRGPDGAVLGFIELFEDLTERKKAEDALQKSEEKFRGIAERSFDAIFVTDAEGTITYLSPAVEKLYLLKPEEMVGRRFTEFVAEDEIPRAMRHFAETTAPGGTARFEFKAIRKDGSQAVIELSACPLREHERVVGSQGILRDISQRKRTEELLQQAKESAEAANRAKSEFLANMSHEIRTPMTAILGFADLLTMPGLSGRDQHQYLDAIQRNGQALLDLINDILDLSRIEADRLTLEPTDCSVRQIVEDVLSVCGVRAHEKGLILRADYRPPLPAIIHTDPARLRQILVNLVGNAVKFTERGGVTVRVEVRRLQNANCKLQNEPPHAQAAPSNDQSAICNLQFAVSDTGIGIPADKLRQIFLPFVQADASLTRRFGGTGLGLAISTRLAKALGGSIEVVSEPGKGSIFTLSIDVGPLEDMGVKDEADGNDGSPPADSGVPPPQRSLAGRVLLAEDAPDVQFMMREILRQSGIEIEIAENGRTACEMAERSRADGRPYDVILMDIQMPEMNGYQATRCLRRQGWPGPIVAVTAHAMLGDREKCLEAGCTDYLAKPVSAATLREALARYLPASR